MDTTSIVQNISSTQIDSLELFNFLTSITDLGDASSTSYARQIPTSDDFLHKGPEKCTAPATFASDLLRAQQKWDKDCSPASIIMSFRVIAYTSQLYGKLTAPTVPLKIVERPLFNQAWIPSDIDITPSHFLCQ